MPQETRLAFAHPEERAAATASSDPRDRISLRDHLVEADIGAFQHERGVPQRLRFDVVVEVRPAAGPLDDDVDRILSYEKIIEAIDAVLAAERFNLLETLAERVAERLLQEPRAMRVFVRIAKLDRGPFELGVEIVRSRAAMPLGAVDGAGAIHPDVVFLDNDTITAPDLPARLDALQQGGAPLILCVGLPDGGRPVSAVAPARRRIDLLAIEQNAWVLAGRDRRCVVVSSRTEIDSALHRGQVIVWAPSKMVLDAVDGPGGADPLRLALWLAEEFAAARLIVHGDVSLPAGSRVRVERAPA
ncbi:diguanylate cyclase [Defluviimonas sp. 20V17]|uniref:dihydroneopterin aldolase n=1 Tax=Allgaiera indica TaxID=765699 RepID=A0AAN4USP8_9RHOB|nr:dihydroneopterin aldolase [Allgaiera indica]KDB02074.1 diguanylate cyclase [Defluviimonas sp. 20V17]GHE03150.1 diguanylate cyclase [Allgaiera indica]SDX10534.1 dihydroneopterin aldolase [Allgaiera indica]